MRLPSLFFIYLSFTSSNQLLADAGIPFWDWRYDPETFFDDSFPGASPHEACEKDGKNTFTDLLPKRFLGPATLKGKACYTKGAVRFETEPEAEYALCCSANCRYLQGDFDEIYRHRGVVYMSKYVENRVQYICGHAGHENLKWIPKSSTEMVHIEQSCEHTHSVLCEVDNDPCDEIIEHIPLPQYEVKRTIEEYIPILAGLDLQENSPIASGFEVSGEAFAANAGDQLTNPLLPVSEIADYLEYIPLPEEKRVCETDNTNSRP